MKRSLPTEGDDDGNSPYPGRHSSAPATGKMEPPPPKVRRKGKGIMSALRTLTASGSSSYSPRLCDLFELLKLMYSSGSDRSGTTEHEGCLPTPPASPTKGSKHKTSFSQKISKVNTLLRGPFDGSSNHKHKQKERRSLKSQQSVETMDTIETGSVLVLSPASSSKTATTASSSNSNSTSIRSPVSTGKTSVDSRFTSASGQERDLNSSADRKQLNSGTVVTRPHPGAHMRSSPEGNLAPIQETALDYASVTILTVERAAAAKIYLETYYNTLLSPDPTPREKRRQKLEMHDENFTPEQQERMRYNFYRRETAHLREYRIMKARSIRARTAEKWDPAARLDDEYELLKILGKGSFGVVRLVREKSSANPNNHGSPAHTPKQVYAMKVIRKSDMLRTSQEGHLRAERDFLVASEGSDWYDTLLLILPVSGSEVNWH
jgi:protein-serine/threonine kinase